MSGGADSVALLLALDRLSKEEGFLLSAAHVDHGLRKESGQDAAFVEELCEKLGVPCRVFRLHLDSSDENTARNARYDALLHGFPEERQFFLALAHHQRDQAETMLLHLLRGSGSHGLGGMRERTERATPSGGTAVLWRPLLHVDPDRIRSTLISQHIPWREDSTNQSDRYLRNFLRKSILPPLRQRMPDAESAMARSAALLSDEDDYLDCQARDYLLGDGHACAYAFCCWAAYPPLAGLHVALRRRVLRMLCPVPLDSVQTETLARLSPGETMNLPQGWQARCTHEKLHFLPPSGAGHPDDQPILGNWIVTPCRRETGDGIRRQAMPASVARRCTLRTWQPGDRIRPLGAPGSKSLQDYFTDKKVPRPFRRIQPLLCIGQEVIWVIGVGPSESVRVENDTDPVMVEYSGFLPGDPGGLDDTDAKGEGKQ